MKTTILKQVVSRLGLVTVLAVLGACNQPYSTNTWVASSDTIARFNATRTAYVATAIAQGTPQPWVSTPTADSAFYLTQVSADTQTAQVINPTLTDYKAHVGTAIAQGTPYAALVTSTDDLLARIQQTALAETAVAQGTPVASLPTFTPAPTLTPQPTATFIALPVVPTDWYSNPITGPFLGPVRALGGEDLVNKLVVALLTILGTALLFSLKSIIRGFYGLGKSIWDMSRRLNKDFMFERAYLDWMIGQYRHLGMLPAQVAARRWGERQQLVDLEQIYTRLSLSNQADDETWNIQTASKTRWSKVLHPALRLLKGFLRVIFTVWLSILERFLQIMSRFSSTQISPSASFDLGILEKWFPEPTFVPGSLSLIIDRTPRLVIKGDPGSGKTTLMRYLAITCARALRENQEEGDSKHMVFQRLSWGTRPYPVMIRLSRHADVIQWGDQKSLIDAFRDELPIDLRRRCPEGFFERLLSKKPCLILLDAFDELGSPQARSMMSDYVRGFLEIYGKEKHRFIVTTRVIGYEGQLDRVGFQSRLVQPLQQDERKSLIHLRYKAYTLVEQLGRTPAESRSIEWYLQQREHALVERIEKMPRLAQLATNPMLLSLITLVHFLKVELPDERVLLYRDCVEILTERWQRYKREETGRGDYPAQDLTLAQKTKLLQELAYAMQGRRDVNSSQALLSKRVAITVIADVLVHFFGDESNTEELNRRAEEWIMGIQTDSGILLEQGLDQDGEPMIGFSHLTFQEYLSAVAINATPGYLDVLMHNLGNPAWREVIRLYVVLTDDATPIINALSSSNKQPDGHILAGWCLTEKLKKVNANVVQTVRGNLLVEFKRGNANLEEIAQIFEKTNDILYITPFLLEQIEDSNPEIQIAAIQASRGISAENSNLPKLRAALISIVDLSSAIKVRVAAQNTLTYIGDPRFESYTPLMVKVPAYSLQCVQFDDFAILRYDRGINILPRNKILVYILTWLTALGEPMRVATRFMTQKIYVLWRRFFLRSKNYVDEFEIARFPVTNFEYSRFLNETDYAAPIWWGGLSYPPEKALHPVTGITYRSAEAYCKWLSQKTGDDYQLPLEWEWEAAAGLVDGNIYPWGNDFDPTKCNSIENDLKDTTPVGIYYDIRSPCGMQDSSGNVEEFVRMPFRAYFTWCVTTELIILLALFAMTRSIIATMFLTVFLSVFALVAPGGMELLFGLLGAGFTKGGSYLSGQNRARSFERYFYDARSTRGGSGFRVARYGRPPIKSHQPASG